jgi:S1-C subfamily serine protease
MKALLLFMSGFVFAGIALLGFFESNKTTVIATPPLTVATSSLATSTSVPPATINASTTLSATSSSPPKTATTSPKKPANKPKIESPEKTVHTIEIEAPKPPYGFPPDSFETIDSYTRAALVNIICMPQSGTLRPISGSGVIIDSRGLILTNAHVAQYVLLSQSKEINLICTIRTGSPASPRWRANVLYIPPVWISEHFSDINSDHKVGTGEHDYALLLVTTDTRGNLVTEPFPFLPIDARQHITLQSEMVLGAGYPAEFVGGIVAQQNLYAVTSISKISQLLTFSTSSIDIFNIGGVIEAQSGSSGGPVVNAWRYVIGIITTTSEGATTAQRQLHALTMEYIARDIEIQSGQSLQRILQSDLNKTAENFTTEIAPSLIQKYVEFLSR